MTEKKYIIVIFLLMTIIGSYFAFRTFFPQYRYGNLAPEANIVVFQTGSGAGGKPPESIIDGDENTFWYGYVDGEHPNWIELRWDEPKQIDKIVVNFGGNRQPANYKLQIWDGGSWSDKFTIVENQAEVVKHIFEPEKVLSSKIRLYVTQVLTGDNLMRVTEFYVYKKSIEPFSFGDFLHYLTYVSGLLLILFLLFRLLSVALSRGHKGVGIPVLGVVVLFPTLLLLNSFYQDYLYLNISPDAKVFARQTEWRAFGAKQGGSPLWSINDDDKRTWWYSRMDGRHPNWIVLQWDRPREIDKIEINFGYGRVARDYEIQTWNGHLWETKVSVEDNKVERVVHRLIGKNRIISDRIRFYFTRSDVSKSDCLLQVSEICIYSKVPATFLKALSANIMKPLNCFLIKIFYSLLFLTLLFIPGYVLLILLFPSTFNPEERYVVSFALTFLLISIFTIFSLYIRSLIPIHLLTLAVVLSIFIFIKRKMYLGLRVEIPVTLLLISALLLLSTYLFTRNINLYAFDYLWQYGVANRFMHTHLNYPANSFDYMVVSYSEIGLRTILLAVVSIPFMEIFGKGYPVYEALSSLSTLLFIAPLFLLIKKKINERTAIVTTLFVIVSQYLIFMGTLSQVRWFIVYFLLIYIYFLMDATRELRTKYLWAGCFAGLAFMTHPVSTPFILGGFMYILLKEPCFKRRITGLLYVLIPLASFVLSWFLWCIKTGQGFTYYFCPFYQGTTGWDTPTRMISNYLKLPFHRMLTNRMWTTLSLFFFNTREAIPKSTDFFTYQLRNIESFYRFTLTGAIMLSMVPFAVCGFFKYFRKCKREFWSFFVIPIIAVSVFFGDYVVRMMDELVMLVPLIMALGVYFLLRLGIRGLVLLVYSFCLIEHFYVVYILAKIPWPWSADPLYKTCYGFIHGIISDDFYFLIGSLSLILIYTLLTIILFRCLLKPKDKLISEEVR